MFGDVFNDMFRGWSTSGKEHNGQKILKWNFLTGLVGRPRNPVPALVRVHIYVGIDLKVLVRRLQ